MGIRLIGEKARCRCHVLVRGVNLQDIAIQVPVSVAVPIGVAANVCGVSANVLASLVQNGGASCAATSSSQALSRAIGNAIV